jgi:hypothetical protein
MNLVFRQTDGRVMLTLSQDGEGWIQVSPPFRVCFLGGEAIEGSYSLVQEHPGAWTATGRVSGQDGTVVEVVDTWRVMDEDAVRVDREAAILSAGTSSGVRVEFAAQTTASGVGGLGDWQFCIPGALYNKNDTDHDAVEDYLGTYHQDYRDDRLPSLAVLAYLTTARRYVSLARVSRPEFDTSLTAQQILHRHFLQKTDIGSLGLAPLPEPSTQMLLRASCPFSEEFTFCLNTDRDGWAAYLENRAGPAFRVSYELAVAPALSLSEAIWQVTERQRRTFRTAPEPPGFSLEASLDYRLALVQQFYRKWDPAEDPKEPAGYMVHFSPRKGKTQGTLLEYGFTGAQPLLAYASLRYGYDRQVPLWVERACTVIDFFVNHCQLDNGFSHGIYDVAKHNFVYWFTGILLPFQYAQDEVSLRRYLGSKITKALSPIAEKLRHIKGNYTRTMCESMYPILLAYQVEGQHGRTHENWLRAAERFGAFLLRVQGEDGSWFRGYDANGTGLQSPPEWFGASDTERKSGTIFPIPVLIELHKVTGDRNYLEAAEKAARFIIQTYVEPVEYVGGLNDTTHIKSVKTDAVGVMFAMRSLLKVYEATRNPFYLEGAVKAAKVLASWVYLWNVPFPTDSLLGSAGFKSIGWTVCDVIPAGSYLDNEFLEFTGDLVKVAEHSGERGLFDIAEIVEHGMQHALSAPGNMLGYVAAGIQCEGIMTSYWLSDPETTEFSGAANKVKGQDNDTCNGLINGQAAYGLFELRDAYGTIDFGAIRKRIFHG